MCCKVGSLGCAAYDFCMVFLAFLFYCLWNRAAFVCVYRVIFPCLNSSRCFAGVELYLLFSQGYLLHANKQNVITYLYICNYCL